jgi:UDP-3-O-[3-hydroxymyristoyl] glucosamine N-acyltransferase
MQATLFELAELVGGDVIGDGRLLISGASPLCTARSGQITLMDDCTDGKSTGGLTEAAAVVTSRSRPPLELPAIRVDDVHVAFALIVSHFRPQRHKSRVGVSARAYVSPSAQLEDGVDVHPHATVGDDVRIAAGSTIHAGVQIMSGCTIGRNTTIFSNVVLYEDTVVGDRCVVHANAVLGAWGFGYNQVNNRHELSPQLGNVVLEDDVEVGAGTTIDRGTYGSTIIGEGTKIDDQVMIAHNCRIGKHNMLCSQVGIAGSTSTGDYVVMAGQVGVRDHVHVGDRAVLGAMAGITNNVAEGTRMIGIPATPEREQKIKQAAFTKLPEMRRQLKKLQAKVDRLAERMESPDDRADGDSSPRRAVA